MRHNANDVAYAQMPGRPLCSIIAIFTANVVCFNAPILSQYRPSSRLLSIFLCQLYFIAVVV